MTIVHSDQCVKEQADWKKRFEAFVTLFPDYCKSCNGWGVTSHQENQSPLGSGLVWNETITDICDPCASRGACPRCGKKIFPDDNEDGDKYNAWCESDETYCPHCGWHWGKNLWDTAPEQPECMCWLEEERKDAEELELWLTQRDDELAEEERDRISPAAKAKRSSKRKTNKR